MGFPSRVDAPGTWHHVMNRGSCRRPVFMTRRDGEWFMGIVADWSERTEVEVHAYCLMSNHFHLLVRSGAGRLAEFMQQVTATYTRRFNRRIGGDGAIFRGRYRALHVDSDAYLDVAGRYIHRNPIDVRPRVKLDHYRWSSYRYYTGRLPAPTWLHTSELLGRAGGADGYRELVEGCGGAPITRRSLSQLIPFAIDEASDGIDRRTVRLERTVATALLDHVPEATAAAMLDALDFPSANARDSARSRARRTARDEPAVRAIIHRLRDATT